MKKLPLYALVVSLFLLCTATAFALLSNAPPKKHSSVASASEESESSAPFSQESSYFAAPSETIPETSLPIDNKKLNDNEYTYEPGSTWQNELPKNSAPERGDITGTPTETIIHASSGSRTSSSTFPSFREQNRPKESSPSDENEAPQTSPRAKENPSPEEIPFPEDNKPPKDAPLPEDGMPPKNTPLPGDTEPVPETLPPETEEDFRHYSHDFIVLQEQTNGAGELCFSAGNPVVLPESSLIGLKRSGENDGLLHEIVWSGNSLSTVMEGKAGVYPLLAATKENMVINTSSYDPFTFVVTIRIE